MKVLDEVRQATATTPSTPGGRTLAGPGSSSGPIRPRPGGGTRRTWGQRRSSGCSPTWPRGGTSPRPPAARGVNAPLFPVPGGPPPARAARPPPPGGSRVAPAEDPDYAEHDGGSMPDGRAGRRLRPGRGPRPGWRSPCPNVVGPGRVQCRGDFRFVPTQLAAVRARTGGPRPWAGRPDHPGGAEDRPGGPAGPPAVGDDRRRRGVRGPVHRPLRL